MKLEEIGPLLVTLVTFVLAVAHLVAGQTNAALAYSAVTIAGIIVVFRDFVRSQTLPDG